VRVEFVGGGEFDGTVATINVAGGGVEVNVSVGVKVKVGIWVKVGTEVFVTFDG
jgi:hypothetical protein